jgi:hypothetical protein
MSENETLTSSLFESFVWSHVDCAEFDLSTAGKAFDAWW